MWHVRGNIHFSLSKVKAMKPTPHNVAHFWMYAIDLFPPSPSLNARNFSKSQNRTPTVFWGYLTLTDKNWCSTDPFFL